jgi:hypothetical protein
MFSLRSAAGPLCSAAVTTSPRLSFEPEDTPLQGESLKAAKYALSAVPSGMVRSMQIGRSGKTLLPSSRRKGASKARIGVSEARFYNEIASRPYPRNGISLEQQIQCELGYTVPLLSTSNVGLVVGTSYAAVMSAFTASASLLAVFDQYRFDQIEVWLEPVAAAGTTAFGQFISAVDLDDANVPTLASQVQDHPMALVGTGGAGHYHKWKPHMAVAVYSGAFNSFANEPAGWIDSGSPNVQHYGIKTVTSGFAATIAYTITVRAVISFRAPAIA